MTKRIPLVAAVAVGITAAAAVAARAEEQAIAGIKAEVLGATEVAEPHVEPWGTSAASAHVIQALGFQESDSTTTFTYSGITTHRVRTGGGFPFFSAVLGWLGVFLTGSDTSANALFGNLQVVTANALNLNPVLTASVNSAAGVMGKMISVQSIAVAVAATGMTRADESKLFRFTIKHSVFLMVIMGIISMLFAYVFPGSVPVAPPK